MPDIPDYNISIFFSRVADSGGVDPDPDQTFEKNYPNPDLTKATGSGSMHPYFRKRIKRKTTKIAPSVNPTLPSHSTLTGKVS